jgi:hypothetical protein
LYRNPAPERIKYMTPGQTTSLQQPLPRDLPGADLRVWERHACGVQSSCHPLAARGSSDCCWPGKVRDVSAGGIGLVLSRRFEPGAGLVVELPNIPGQPSETLLARVVHATPVANGYWALGCAFVRELTEHELQSLLRLCRTPQASGGPRVEVTLDRLAVLSPGHPQQRGSLWKTLTNRLTIAAVFFDRLGAEGSVVRLQVRHLHVKGVWPPPVETILSAAAGDKVDKATGIRLLVHRCDQEEGRWAVRYTFADPPSPETLRLFGGDRATGS